MSKRVVIALIALSFAAACSDLEPLAETTRETIEIESVDLPGALWDPLMPPISTGVPVTIDARLTLPPTDEPVPVVILTHGCGGVGDGEIGWVSFLERMGIGTLLVDSFSARGISSICSGGETVNLGSILVDVFRGAEVIDDHPYVDGNRMAILGLSFGGRAALWSALTRFQDLYDGREFLGHVAFYPSTCYIQLEGEDEVSDGPIRIFHGTADDWTPIDQCRDYIGRLSNAGVDAELLEYEGAHHAFDNSSIQVAELAIDALSPRNCTFVERGGEIIDVTTGEPAGVTSRCVRLGVHVGYDEQSRDRAREDLLAFLEEVFASS